METLVGTATRLSSDLTIFGMRRTTLLQDILYPEESKKKRSDFCESDLRKHADYGLLCAFHEQAPFVMQGILCGKLRIYRRKPTADMFNMPKIRRYSFTAQMHGEAYYAKKVENHLMTRNIWHAAS